MGDTTNPAAASRGPEGQQRPRSIRLPPPVAPAHRGWRRLPLGPRAQLARFGLAVFLVAVVLSSVTIGRNIVALRDLRAEGAGSADPAAVSPPNLTLLLAVVAGGLLAGVVFILWLHRVYRNWATQGKPRYSPSWAVLAFFVPPFNLWRPVRIMVDLFADRPGMKKIDNADAWLIAVWWITGLGGVLGRFGLRYWDVSSLADRLNWHYAALGTHALVGLSIVAALILITQLTARHDVDARP